MFTLTSSPRISYRYIDVVVNEKKKLQVFKSNISTLLIDSKGINFWSTRVVFMVKSSLTGGESFLSSVGAVSVENLIHSRRHNELENI